MDREAPSVAILGLMRAVLLCWGLQDEVLTMENIFDGTWLFVSRVT